MYVYAFAKNRNGRWRHKKGGGEAIQGGALIWAEEASAGERVL
jgi:hypothetical protein